MHIIKNWLLVLSLLFIGNSVAAQVTKVSIGVNGLTCSQCSRSVYNALNKLDFIENLAMDLNETIAHVTFKKNVIPDFEAMAGAVLKAGYKVRSVIVDIDMAGFQKIKDNIICMNSICFYLDKDVKDVSETVQIELISKIFNADKQLQKVAEDMELELKNFSDKKQYKVGRLLLSNLSK